MSAVFFLLIAVVLSTIGSTILVLRHRKPSGLNHGIEAFRREMEALAPPDEHRHSR